MKNILIVFIVIAITASISLRMSYHRSKIHGVFTKILSKDQLTSKEQEGFNFLFEGDKYIEVVADNQTYHAILPDAINKTPGQAVTISDFMNNETQLVKE